MPATTALLRTTDAFWTARADCLSLPFSRGEDKSKQAHKFIGERFIWQLLGSSEAGVTYKQSARRSSSPASLACPWQVCVAGRGERTAPTKCSDSVTKFSLPCPYLDSFHPPLEAISRSGSHFLKPLGRKDVASFVDHPLLL